MRITRKQAFLVLRATFPEYRGRKIELVFRESVSFWDTNWFGGTRSEYRFVDQTGASAKLEAPAPWSNPIEGKTVALPVGVLCVKHTIFCGRDMGIEIIANPAWAPKWVE